MAEKIKSFTSKVAVVDAMNSLGLDAVKLGVRLVGTIDALRRETPFSTHLTMKVVEKLDSCLLSLSEVDQTLSMLSAVLTERGRSFEIEQRRKNVEKKRTRGVGFSDTLE